MWKCRTFVLFDVEKKKTLKIFIVIGYQRKIINGINFPIYGMYIIGVGSYSSYIVAHLTLVKGARLESRLLSMLSRTTSS